MIKVKLKKYFTFCSFVFEVVSGFLRAERVSTRKNAWIAAE